MTCQHSLMACCSSNFIDILEEVAYERKLIALYSYIYSPSFAGDKRVREVKLTDIRRPLSRTRANGGGFKPMTLNVSRLPLSGDLKDGRAALLSMLTFS